MHIEAGKFYRTREGKKVGPASRDPTWAERWSLKQGYLYSADGKYLGGTVDLDLIEEWSDEPAKPELPKFDVEKLREAFEDVYGPVGLSGPYNRALLAVAEYARDITLNPPKDPVVEVLAEKLWAAASDPDGFKPRFDFAEPETRKATLRLASHILETYPDAHERL